MTTRNLILSSLFAAVVSAGAGLLTQWLFERTLTLSDYISSITVGILMGLAVCILFRKRPRCR